MRDDGKKQLDIINKRNKRVKNAFEQMNDAAVMETLRAESIDIIPLGQADEQNSLAE